MDRREEPCHTGQLLVMTIWRNCGRREGKEEPKGKYIMLGDAMNINMLRKINTERVHIPNNCQPRFQGNSIFDMEKIVGRSQLSRTIVSFHKIDMLAT